MSKLKIINIRIKIRTNSNTWQIDLPKIMVERSRRYKYWLLFYTYFKV